VYVYVILKLNQGIKHAIKQKTICKNIDWRGRIAVRIAGIMHAFCILDSHYHLALETPEANLSVGMQWHV